MKIKMVRNKICNQNSTFKCPLHLLVICDQKVAYSLLSSSLHTLLCCFCHPNPMMKEVVLLCTHSCVASVIPTILQYSFHVLYTHSCLQSLAFHNEKIEKSTGKSYLEQLWLPFFFAISEQVYIVTLPCQSAWSLNTYSLLE